MTFIICLQHTPYLQVLERKSVALNCVQYCHRFTSYCLHYLFPYCRSVLAASTIQLHDDCHVPNSCCHIRPPHLLVLQLHDVINATCVCHVTTVPHNKVVTPVYHIVALHYQPASPLYQVVAPYYEVATLLHHIVLRFLYVADYQPGGGWIGLNDRHRENDWVWSDGTTVVFTNWKSGKLLTTHKLIPP